MTTSDQRRAPSGTPVGGQFAPMGRTESPVALEVEFNAAQAAQVDQALVDHADLIAADEHLREWAANQSARATLSGLRVHLAATGSVRRIFTSEEVKQMAAALDYHRHRSIEASPGALPAIDAAQMRLYIAEPLHRESDVVTDPDEDS